MYVGGHFGRVFPLTGGGIIVDPVSGAWRSESPAVAGSLDACIPDGRGGWVIGGSFSAVGNQPRANLAHILADGRVAGWAPSVNGEVVALALGGEVLFVGGAFSSVDGAPRRNVAAVDLVTGEVLPWTADTDGSVRSIVTRAGLVVLGGQFTHVGSVERHGVAAVGSSTPEVLGWNPNVDGAVNALLVAGDTLFLGGSFHYVDGLPRELVASVPLSGDSPTSFQVPLSQSPPITGFEPAVHVLLMDGDLLYVGGIFDHVGGAERQGLVAVDRRTGSMSTWSPNLLGGTIPGSCSALALCGHSLYVGGSFQSLGGLATGSTMAGAVDTRTGVRLPWQFAPNHLVQSYAISGAQLYVGGLFTGAGEPVPRAGLAAFDLLTGELLPWNPAADGDVFTLAAQGGVVYLGGTFNSIDGQPRPGLAAVDTVDGTVAQWNPGCDGAVLSLQADDSLLYVGGDFTLVGGLPRRNLAAVGLSSGLVSGWDPSADDMVESIALGSGTVYACGFFSTVGSQRRQFVAAIDPLTGLATPWRMSQVIGGDRIAVEDSTVFVAGPLLPPLGAPSVTALLAASATTGRTIFSDTLDLGAPGASANVSALAVHNHVAYLGGAFTVVAGTTQPRCAAIDGHTGQVLAWNPRIDSPVFALSVDSTGVCAGGGMRRAGTVPCGSTAFLTLAGAPSPPAPPPPPVLTFRVASPSNSSIVVEFALGQPNQVHLDLYDIQGRHVQTVLAGAAMGPGHHVVRFDSSGFHSGFYFCRLHSGETDVTAKVVVLR